MSVCSSSAKAGKVFETADLSVSLDSSQVGSTPFDHRLRRVAPGTQILVRTHDYRHIHIWREVCVDPQCLQVVRNAVPELRCILYLTRLIRFQSSWAMPIDIHNALDKAPLLVGRD